MLTKKQRDKLTNKQTPLKTSTSLRCATPVGNYSSKHVTIYSFMLYTKMRDRSSGCDVSQRASSIFHHATNEFPVNLRASYNAFTSKSTSRLIRRQNGGGGGGGERRKKSCQGGGSDRSRPEAYGSERAWAMVVISSRRRRAPAVAD